MSKVTKKANVSIVEPSINIPGHTNPFVPFYETSPELTAVGYVRIPGTNDYCSYTVTIKGGEVVKINCEEPNLKLIAEESAKIAFVNNFVDKEEE